MIEFRCACGKKTSIEGHGAYNVGEAIRKTGWHYGSCSYTSKAVWLCEECFPKAAVLAIELFKLIRTPYYHLVALLPKEITEEFYKKNG